MIDWLFEGNPGALEEVKKLENFWAWHGRVKELGGVRKMLVLKADAQIAKL